MRPRAGVCCSLFCRHDFSGSFQVPAGFVLLCSECIFRFSKPQQMNKWEMGGSGVECVLAVRPRYGWGVHWQQQFLGCVFDECNEHAVPVPLVATAVPKTERVLQMSP